jgi:hypothetical protein
LHFVCRREQSDFDFRMHNATGSPERLRGLRPLSFSVAAKDVLLGAEARFDPPVVQKIVDLFALGQDGLEAFLADLAGRAFDPASFARDPGVRDALRARLKKPENLPLDVVIVTSLVVLASGGGTRVRIDARNHYDNVGYRPGGDGPGHAADAKSGRSFMTSPVHMARDTSDIAYLKDLGSYLSGPATEIPTFFRTLLELLTRCDPAGYAKLSDPGQSVVTDFVGVYTAELDRNLMDPVHRWENDLAEVTFLSAYGCAAKRVNKGGRLVEGDPVDYFGVGPQGSGIGETRTERRALQQAVSAAVRTIVPGAIDDLARLVGVEPDGDVFRGLMQLVNDPARQAVVEADGARLVDLTVGLLSAMRDHAPELTDAIGKRGLPSTSR